MCESCSKLRAHQQIGATGAFFDEDKIDSKFLASRPGLRGHMGKRGRLLRRSYWFVQFPLGVAMFVNTELWRDVARMVVRVTGDRQPASRCPTHASFIFGQAISWRHRFCLFCRVGRQNFAKGGTSIWSWVKRVQQARARRTIRLLESSLA